MIAFVRPDAPREFVDNETKWLDDVSKRRHEGCTGEKLFLPHWREHKSQIARHELVAKCGYCEVVRSLGRELDIEHVRPKGALLRWVSCDDDTLLYPAKAWRESEQRFVEQKPVEDRASADVGYEWLAYRWSNYLLACKDCNSGWKREFFPLRDPARRWRRREDEASDERALLLDPTEAGFDPTLHFRWIAGGVVQPISQNGAATIITCGLNRELLRVERLRTLQAIEAWVDALASAMETADEARGRTAFRMLAACTDARAPFTTMARARFEELRRDRGMRVPRPWTPRATPATSP